MSIRGPENIRNIALVGPAGSGKTTLAEALLNVAGAVAGPGSVEKGSTVSDADPQEQRLHHSISASVLGLEWGDAWIDLIDTPGYADFRGAALSILPAVEVAAVVISASGGIDATARSLMAWAQDRRMCRMIIVNGMDADPTALPGLLEALRTTFGPECLALNLPAGGGSRVADCFFEPAGESDFSSVAEVHEMLVDQVVEMDDALMDLYLEQGESLNPAQLHDAFEAALRDGHLVPVCFTSAATGAGVRELLDVFVRLMPNPLEGNPPPFIRQDEQGVREYHAVPDPDAHVLAHVVKVEHDPFLGKVAVFRVHQGTVTRETRLFAGDARKPFRVGNLFRLQGREHLPVERCGPGEIGALTKVEEVSYGTVLHDSHDEDHIQLRPPEIPAPVFGLAVQAARHGDEQKLSDALTKLVEEDPGLNVEQDPATRETVLRGQGELHLRMALERMRERFNLEVETATPSIAYRETITAPAEGHCRHKKQTGGAGQFGEVFLRVEPLARGKGFEFTDEIRGASIPGSLLPAVEKGIRQAMAEGAVAGYPLQDVRVTVYDGKTHPVDSKEVAFVIAGRKAFLDAVRKARPIVLEPMAELSVEAPAEAMGDLSGDLSVKRGRIVDTQALGERMSLQAVVPLAELAEYPARLNALTGGAGSYTLQFSHYEQVPEQVQRSLVQAWRPKEE
ncbi:elongation factor G [Thioalkalivibrio denitrificans]|uniref:Elongation factor G n=1 Tax=Thioalkalivibrio denitrificans TaxID=108003 RepID=A0A1V3NAW8_9GAMM|nr:elongation factor G [Thioalkalivibrio denitrificans]OOG22200.1 elongation factor G [Thioalkalivibrio denitrificans]